MKIAEIEIPWMEEVVEKLSQRFDDGILHVEQAYDLPVVVIAKQNLIEVLTFLKSDSDMGFAFLTTLCGLHIPGYEGGEFGMMYQLHNMHQNRRLRIKTYMPESDLDVPTVSNLWPTANWMERQEYDFFGFNFVGHPDLRRILNMDEMNYHPLRKQYPLEDLGKHDKDDAKFGR